MTEGIVLGALAPGAGQVLQAISAIALLVDFGFRHGSADAIFGIVSADNSRSLRAFQKCGFGCHAVIHEEDGTSSYDLVVTSADLPH